VRILVDLSVHLKVAGKKPSILVYCVPFRLTIQIVYLSYYIPNILITNLTIWEKTNLEVNTQEFYSSAEDKAIPVQDRTGPEGSMRLRIPHFKTHEGGKVVSPTHRSPLSSWKHSCYAFLLEAESTPGPLLSQKDYVTVRREVNYNTY
jgi:hypothetical protein